MTDTTPPTDPPTDGMACERCGDQPGVPGDFLWRIGTQGWEHRCPDLPPEVGHPCLAVPVKPMTDTPPTREEFDEAVRVCASDCCCEPGLPACLDCRTAGSLRAYADHLERKLRWVKLVNRGDFETVGQEVGDGGDIPPVVVAAGKTYSALQRSMATAKRRGKRVKALERKLLAMELELRELELEGWEARLVEASKGEPSMLGIYTYEACKEAVYSTRARIAEIRRQLEQ